MKKNETVIDKNSVSPYLIKKLHQGQRIMVSDASVNGGHGSFAWILTDKDETEKYVFRANIDVVKEALTSNRAERCGIRDMTQFLFRNHISKTTPVKMFCDNLSEVERGSWIHAPYRKEIGTDDGVYEEIALPEVPLDPLKFRDEKKYVDRLRDAKAKTSLVDAVKIAYGKVEALPLTIGVQDFDFMGGSLGMAAGEAVVKGLETAAERGTPFIMFAASGGARMQEGILSLMQLPRTTVAVQMLREAKKPYIVVLTNPTTGGVTASYAMLGDVQIAEPGALVGFAGPRVIEQTIREKLPEGFQKSEFLRDHGMVDMVVHRKEMKKTLAALLRQMK